MNRAYAEGAAIISDDGLRVRYHPQCPICGKIDMNCTRNYLCQFTTSDLGPFRCSKCGETFRIVLHRNN